MRYGGDDVSWKVAYGTGHRRLIRALPKQDCNSMRRKIEEVGQSGDHEHDCRDQRVESAEEDGESGEEKRQRDVEKKGDKTNDERDLPPEQGRKPDVTYKGALSRRTR